MIKPPCADNPELWFGSVPDRREAISICSSCPLNLACFEMALARGEKWGVWGGIDFTRDQMAADADMFPKRKPGRPRKEDRTPAPWVLAGDKRAAG